MTKMLKERVREWVRPWDERGFRDGVELGRLEGGQEVLLRQMARRFGPVDAAVRRHVETATVTQLETWAGNILRAQCIEEMFGEPGACGRAILSAPSQPQSRQTGTLRRPPLVLTPPHDRDDILALLENGAGKLQCVWEDRGYQDAIEKGYLEGQRDLLLWQVNRNFSRVCGEMRRRIETATPVQLETWADNILDAKRIEDVFAEN
jgi:hypothetical protein